jgi:2-keto-3-deoxy-L-rhamnonate aldolase RhmA
VRENTLKKLLRDDRPAIGCLLAYDAPWLIEVLGLVGYDYVVIDAEHEPLSEDAVAGLVRTADAAGIPAIVRMACTDRLTALLSLGLAGVQIPDLRGTEHAAEIVSAVRFHPLGRRTYYSQTRAADYGIRLDEPGWTEAANDRLFVIAMLEDVKVIDGLDEILQVEGIDAFHIGVMDLAQSMGFPPRPELDAAIEKIIGRCRSAGRHVAVGALVPWGLESIDKWYPKGVRLFSVASAWMLTNAVAQVHAAIQEHLPAEFRKESGMMGSNPYLGSGRPPSPNRA